jgi:hypothetical protein
MPLINKSHLRNNIILSTIGACIPQPATYIYIQKIPKSEPKDLGTGLKREEKQSVCDSRENIIICIYLHINVNPYTPRIVAYVLSVSSRATIAIILQLN